MQIITNKISRHTRENHIILCNPFDASSYAASILLRNKYQHLDISFIENKDWRYLFIVKRYFLRKQKKNGKWICHYCLRDIFKMPKRNKKHQNTKDCVTIDHKDPICKCEDKSDIKNMVVCCPECNQNKGSMSYEHFIKYHTKKEVNRFREFESLHSHNLV